MKQHQDEQKARLLVHPLGYRRYLILDAEG
jgi:hypothetical protein